MENQARTDKPDLGWLENPEVFEVNRLPAHSDHTFYESMDCFKQNNNTLKQSLNGTWALKWSANPSIRPKDFMEPGFDISDFDRIEVPGHMELAGYGQIHYTNTTYPWDGHAFLRPPHIDWDNTPVASYVREFDLNDSLIGKRVCISFQGADEAIFVWLNGHFVGYGEDSCTPSDYDITDFVKESGNRLCVELYKRSSAAWIEDQDFFRFSGIFREVFLYAKPDGHIEDLKITADYDVTTGNGIFSFCARLSGESAHHLEWKLQDKDGNTVSEGSLPANDVCELPQTILENITPWDVGKAYLYNLLICVCGDDGRVLEAVPYSVGFRHFAIEDKIMKLNGKRLLVNGVNRHEWSAKTGRAISEDEMRTDISIMKKNGINAVRTCHYPNQSLWYKLCDEAGICVMDETNLESHGSCMKLGITEVSWNVPYNDPKWLGCCVDRARSMYERDKNHPAILWWSAGNESHVGTVIQKMCEFFHESDSTRLVHYEGIVYDRNFDFITDVESRMYPQPDAIREYLENNPAKPVCLCEYMHDMGNSLGGIESYMRLREEFPMFHGGFIWDFIDQALYPRNADGTYEDNLRYGGDFNDRPTDYAFCANGLLFADRTEKPAMDEVRYWYMSDEARAAFDSANAAQLEDYRANVMSDLAKVPDRPAAPGTDGPYLKVVHSDCNIGFSGKDFHYVFAIDKGGPVSLIMNGKEQLYRAPRPTFWRAPTENDIGCNYPARHAVWMGADSFSNLVDGSVEEFGDGFMEKLNPFDFAGRAPAREDIREVEIRYVFLTATTPQTTVTIAYRVNAYGKITVSVDYKGNEALPDMPAFGLQFITPEALDSYSWEGLSGETYPDRYKGAQAGSYTSAVQMTPYLVPQECGNHKDTCRMEAEEMIFMMSDKPFNFSVLPYTQNQIAEAYHQEELQGSPRSIIRILGAVRGVGGFDSWGSDVQPEYHISANDDMHFEFHIVPKAALK